jgi:RNA polymerase sigma-70 factor, ECF subfamily
VEYTSRVLMPILASSRVLDFPARSVAAAPSFAPSPLEDEVVKFFDQCRAPLVRYTRAIGLSAQDAEEIVQEVFIALFRHLQLDRSRSNLQAWIFRVAHNLALKQLQSNRKLPETLDWDADLVNSHPDGRLNPEERIASGQRQQRLRAILRALPKQDQCCLYLRAEGLRYREISRVLGISLGAVSNSITRSLMRLKSADGV